MIETNFEIVLDLCIVFIVLKFLSRGRGKACLLTNHKVKISVLCREGYFLLPFNE